MSGWTISHQISEAAAIDLMRAQVKKPVAVIVIGGNDEVTEKVTVALCQSVGCGHGYVHELTGTVEVDAIRDATFQTHSFVFVNLIHGSSSAHGFRHAVVQRLRAVGAKTIIIVRAKGDPMRDNPNTNAVNEALCQNPPTLDGVDYIFTLEP